MLYSTELISDWTIKKAKINKDKDKDDVTHPKHHHEAFLPDDLTPITAKEI